MSKEQLVKRRRLLWAWAEIEAGGPTEKVSMKKACERKVSAGIMSRRKRVRRKKPVNSVLVKGEAELESWGGEVWIHCRGGDEASEVFWGLLDVINLRLSIM